MVVRTFLPYSKIVKKPRKQQYSINPQTLGEHIRKKRMQAWQTQKEVAAHMGVDEESIFGWETGKYMPQVQWYPRIFDYLGYYPFTYETDSIAGKLLQVRYCNGWSCKRYAEILGCDTATVRRWELGKSAVHIRVHELITRLWKTLPLYVLQQYPSE